MKFLNIKVFLLFIVEDLLVYKFELETFLNMLLHFTGRFSLK